VILAWWQRVLLLIVMISSAGTFAELILLEHTEEFYQLIPVVLLPATAISALLVFIKPRRWSVNLLRFVLLLCFVSSAVGIVLHYLGNTEFELERKPDLKGWTLFSESMMGATPALAPGTMAQLSLVGLLATYFRK
jgi:disulfide bond formation protein DsbB